MLIYKTIPLPEELGEEIEAGIYYSIENDGIGSYEYWGYKCFDKGENYVAIDEIEPIFTNESEELKAKILEYINDNLNQLVECIEIDLSDDDC